MKKTGLLLIWFLFMGMMHGCATFNSRSLSPSETASAFETRTLNSQELKRFLEETLHHEIDQWPPASWDFDTLSLVAIFFHPDVEVARAQWRVAEAGILTAGGRPNPSIEVIPRAEALLDVTLETAGKRDHRIARARYLSEEARLNFETVQWLMRTHLRDRLLDLYQSIRSQAVLSRQGDLEEEIVRLLEQRFNAGEVSQLELSRARTVLETTLLSLSAAQERIAECRAGLAGALGLAVRGLDETDISFDFLESFPPIPDFREIREHALLNRSDLLAALARYGASQAALQLEISGQYPDIDLGPAFIWEGSTTGWTIHALTSLPILNRNRGPIAEAEARRRESADRFIALQAELLGEIDRNLPRYQGALERLEAADSLCATHRKQTEIMEAMLHAGEVDRLVLLSSRVELASAETARIESFVEAQRALGSLENALQKPLSRPGTFSPMPVYGPALQKGGE